jgi:parallel beta-helix repeat protein
MKTLFLALSVDVSANASVGIYSISPQLGTVVHRGDLVRYTFVPFVNDVDETNVVVEFTGAPAIESISGDRFTCSGARCTRALFQKGAVASIALSVRMPSTLAGGHVNVIGTITASSGSTATWKSDVVIPKAFVVSNSLADAITQANAACINNDPCAIELPFSGTISEALPPITAKKLTIDGHKGIVLDGTGLVFSGSADITVSGFTIQNNEGPGILLFGNRDTSLRSTITDNVLTGDLRGVMSYGSSFMYLHDNVISNNRYSGVWIFSGYYPAVYKNTIDGNGASGVFFGPGCQFGMADENQITSNRDFGVAVDPTSRWIEVRGNSMKHNGQLGIDYGLDLVTPNVSDDSARSAPNAPVLTTATYDPITNKTTISGHVDLNKPADVGFFAPLIDIYASRELDAHGMAQGEKPLYENLDYSLPVNLDRMTGNFIYIYSSDLTGQYISATYSRMYALGKGAPTPEYYENWQATSEFSNPVRVQQ